MEVLEKKKDLYNGEKQISIVTVSNPVKMLNSSTKEVEKKLD